MKHCSGMIRSAQTPSQADENSTYDCKSEDGSSKLTVRPSTSQPKILRFNCALTHSLRPIDPGEAMYSSETTDSPSLCEGKKISRRTAGPGEREDSHDDGESGCAFDKVLQVERRDHPDLLREQIRLSIRVDARSSSFSLLGVRFATVDPDEDSHPETHAKFDHHATSLSSQSALAQRNEPAKLTRPRRGSRLCRLNRRKRTRGR